MTLYYQNFSSMDYICFGVALCANVQGLLISTILLKKDWKRNLVIVLANLCYFISNALNFGQKGSKLDCVGTGIIIQLLMILGSIFEVHTPMVRAYTLLTPKLKKIVPAISACMILCQFLVLVQFKAECSSNKKQFVILETSPAPQLLSNVLSIALFFIAFSKIIKLIDKSEFAKGNSKMQLIRSLSKYSLIFAISVKLAQTILDGTQFKFVNDLLHDGAITIALRSNLVVFLMISQFTLELTKVAGDQSTHSNGSNSKHEKSGSGVASGNVIVSATKESKNSKSQKPPGSIKNQGHSIVEVDDDLK